jgi:hypothetical protein
LDLFFLIPKKAIKNRMKAKSRVMIITYLNLMFTRNFELKKDGIFSPLTKTIYNIITGVSRDRDKVSEKVLQGTELGVFAFGRNE